MKKTLCSLIIAILCSCCAFADTVSHDNSTSNIVCKKNIKRSSVTVTEAREINGFHSIKVSDGIMAIVSQSDTWSVEVSADKNLIDHVKTSKSGGILYISYNGIDRVNNVSRTIVRISCPEIRYIKANSAADIMFKGTIRGEKIHADISSAASFVGDIEYETGKFQVSNAADISLSGYCNECKIITSSASEISLEGTYQNLAISSSSSSCTAFLPHVKGNALTINASSTASFKGLVTYDTVAISTSSCAEVILSGECHLCDIQASSGSKVNTTNMPSTVCNVKATSASSVSVLSLESISAHTSQSAELRYVGTPSHIDIREK